MNNPLQNTYIYHYSKRPVSLKKKPEIGRRGFSVLIYGLKREAVTYCDMCVMAWGSLMQVVTLPDVDSFRQVWRHHQ